MKKKSILFLVTEDWYFISHRIKIGKIFTKKGYDVNVCCKNTGKFKDIKDQGIRCLILILKESHYQPYNYSMR